MVSTEARQEVAVYNEMSQTRTHEPRSLVPWPTIPDEAFQHGPGKHVLLCMWGGKLAQTTNFDLARPLRRIVHGITSDVPQMFLRHDEYEI